MIAALPLLVALAIPGVEAGQEADDLPAHVQAAVAAENPAQLSSLVSVIHRNGAGEDMTAQEVVSALSGCTFGMRRASPGRAGLAYLFYTCPERAKTATGCLTGDLTLAVDANDLSVHFIEAVRYDGPNCGPPAVPPPPGGN